MFCQLVPCVLLYSNTHHADSAGSEAASAAAQGKSVQPSLTTTVSPRSDATARQTWVDTGKADSKGRHADVAVKRRQIGLKRKSLQEMRHLLNTTVIAVTTLKVVSSSTVNGVVMHVL